jgi:outer membrane protein TolC
MTEAEAVAEFREASAALRRAYGARDDARVDQILADTRMGQATVNLSDAQARLHAADIALQAARAEPPTPADIDVTKLRFGVTFDEVPAVNGADNTEAL